MYYNFARVHQTLRVTPAMEAKIADHLWTLTKSSVFFRNVIGSPMRHVRMLLVVAFALPACSSATAPSSPVDASGSWTRTGCDQFLTGCKITMAITQSGSSLSGTFTWDGTSGGSLTGTVTNRTASVSLVPKTTPDCQLAVTGVISGDQWTGTETFICTGQVTIGNPSVTPAAFIRTR
jgi:hypothetical protein